MPEAPITDWLYAYRKMMVVDMACQLEVFGLLEERPRSAEQLAAATGARVVPLTLLLQTLVGLGLLSVEEGVYTPREVARAYLVKGRPLYHGDLFRVFVSEAPAWFGLRDLLLGQSTGENTVDSRRFARAMHALGMLGEAEALVSAVDLSGRRNLVDVGCGSGVYSIAFCQRYPDLRVALIDRPEVLEVTAEYLAEGGIQSRATLAPGDFLDGYGQDRDVVLLSDVLYQGSDACRTMLDLAHRALIPDGLLVIRGYFSGRSGDETLFGPLFDLDRLLEDSTREPLLVETVVGWVAAAGFREARSFPLTERSVCILAEK